MHHAASYQHQSLVYFQASSDFWKQIWRAVKKTHYFSAKNINSTCCAALTLAVVTVVTRENSHSFTRGLQTITYEHLFRWAREGKKKELSYRRWPQGFLSRSLGWNSAQHRITSHSVQRHEYTSLTSAVALAATSWIPSLSDHLPGNLNFDICLISFTDVGWCNYGIKCDVYSSKFKVDFWGQYYEEICFEPVEAFKFKSEITE